MPATGWRGVRGLRGAEHGEEKRGRSPRGSAHSWLGQLTSWVVVDQEEDQTEQKRSSCCSQDKNMGFGGKPSEFSLTSFLTLGRILHPPRD